MKNRNIKGKCKQCRYYNINHCMLSMQCNGQYFLKSTDDVHIVPTHHNVRTRHGTSHNTKNK